MSGIKTATVEALTAEVRVLMVGSRQITLSVARQLDAVSPNQITPFGRIAADRRPGENQIEVIGADPDGVLVTSRAGYRWVTCATHEYPVRRRSNPCGKCSMDDESHDWARHWGANAETYSSWMALPLIVLAGLR